MKKFTWFLFASLLCVLAVNLYLYYAHHQLTHLTCQGTATARDETHTLNTQVSLSLSGDLGQAIINGELIDKEGNIFSVHRSSTFRFKQNGNSIYITNYSVAELPNNTVDLSMLKILLPPDILFNAISTRLELYPLGQQKYLITGDEYTHTICEK